MRRRPVFARAHPAPDRLDREDPIDAFQHRRRRSKREVQGYRSERQLGVKVAAFELAPHRVEHRRRRALERKDRLLFIADREECADPPTRALAGQEVGSDFAQDVPLRLRSILRLVDQNMVDAGIELVEHPGRVDVLQQRAGALDQIVEIEPAARVLELGVALQHGLGDRDERVAALDGLGRAQAIGEPLQATLLVVQLLDRGGVALRDGFGREDLSRGTGLREEDAEIHRQREVRIVQRRRGFQSVGALLVGLGSRAELARPIAPPPRPAAAHEHFLLDRLDALVGREPEPAPQTRRIGVGPARRCEFLASSERCAQQRVETVGARDARDCLHRGGEVGIAKRELECGAARSPEQIAGFALLQDAKARRDIGFERKEVQQTLAERVNGLDLEPARRLDRPREQLAREVEVGLRGPGRAGTYDRVREVFVRKRGPPAQFLEHPRRHVGRRRLGEGEAENGAGLGLGEQQAQHALHQNVRLARTRVGGNPSRGLGVGGALLCDPRRPRHFALRSVHGASPAAAARPPVADHSLTRARWS